MPYQQLQVNLAAIVPAQSKQRLVRSGARITGVSVLPPRVPGTAFVLFLQLGNNQQAIGPITQSCVIDIEDCPESDTDEGLFLINDAAQAGVVVPVLVSYLPVTSEGKMERAGRIKITNG